jgi:AcrR family transcriptional regulator
MTTSPRKKRAPTAVGTEQQAGGPAQRPAGRTRVRLSTDERERQILEGAISFFTERGLDGQTRELAQQIGVTHPLLYHYFPSKRALIERVYKEVYLGRWRDEWEDWIEDRTQPLQDRLIRFYVDYANSILTKERVRILIFSGLSDGYIPDQYMELLRERLFPRIWRETRRELGLSLRAKESEDERELMWGLHGGIFYIGIRHWIYSQPMPEDLPRIVRDRVRSFILAAPEVFGRSRGTTASHETTRE